MGEWSVNYKELGKLMKQIEVEKVVEERFGSMGTRLLRIIKEKGRIDEKQVCPPPWLPLQSLTTTDRDHSPPKTEGNTRNPQRAPRSGPPRPPRSPQNRHPASQPDVLPLVLRRRPRRRRAHRRYLQGHEPRPAARRHGAREAAQSAGEVGAERCPGEYGGVFNPRGEEGVGDLGSEGGEAVGGCDEVG